MARKYELITELYGRTIETLTTVPIWQNFLITAGRNFRLSFDEQVLLFAQRPDATAVLPIEGRNGWNKRFGRWVNRGATGIAIFDHDAIGYNRLKYYFDLSDTHESRMARPVPVWNMRPEFASAVIEALENNLGTLEEKNDLGAALLCAAKNATEDNASDYLVELNRCKEGSNLNELDDLTIEVKYRRTLKNSIGYMLLARCGIEPSAYMSSDDLQDVVDFNTQNTLNALGAATGDIGKMCLSIISRTVLTLQRQSKQENRTFAENSDILYSGFNEKTTPYERSEKNEQTNLYNTRRLPPAESIATPRAGGAPWEIRIAAPGVPKAEPQSDLYKPTDIGQAEPALSGDRADSPHPNGVARQPDEESRGRDGGIEGARSDEVDGTDEQHSASGGADHLERIDIQLNEKLPEAGSAELPAFLNDAHIMAIIENRADDLKYKKSQIELYFSIHLDETERATYLKSAYPDRYTEILVDDIRIGYRPQPDGLLMWEGSYLSRTSESVFSWGLVAEWTAQLIEKKEYSIDAQLTPPKQETRQTSLFDFTDNTDATQEENIQIPLIPHPQISQQVIDTALCLGGNEPDCMEHIYAYFCKDYTPEQNAEFLKKEYGENGKGFFIGDRLYAVWFDENGIRISFGRTARENHATLLTWDDAARRVRELLEEGRYVPQTVIDRAEEVEHKTLAEKLLYLVGDFTQIARDLEYLPTVQKVATTRAGYPAMTEQLSGQLKERSTVEKLITELNDFLLGYESAHSLLRFQYHKPKEMLNQLQGLLRDPMFFPAPKPIESSPKQFISDDEIDHLLIGGQSVQDIKFRIYAYYLEGHTPQERANFLKNEYGIGGSGRLGFSENHDSKGISYARENRLFQPYDKILLPWNKVEKRIDALIRQGRYLNEKELDYLPTYEKEQLARDIYHFFSHVPQSQPHPFPYGFDHFDAVRVIQPQLDDPGKVDEIHAMMLPVWESTPQDDHDYTQKRETFENLIAYKNGTFSLFGEKKNFQSASAESPNQPEQADIQESPADTAPEEPSATLPPPKPRRQRVAFVTLHPEIPTAQRHNFCITAPQWGHGTPNEKYAANAAAIRCLKQIEAEERLASPQEQEILARYVGWGGLAECFDAQNPHYEQLKSILDEDEYAAARASTLTAFYTSPVIIEAMYKAVAQMGFQAGNILEPSCGVGNFIGMLPGEMASSKVYGVELDSISGRIAQQLYQNSSIAVSGFEAVQIPDSFFDVAIGNVPFGDFKVLDKRYDKHRWLIHDYFFGKALDKVRPGGIVAFITSKGTMDKENSAVRKYLSQRADLIGAIRLPNNAFKANAGTEVTSDILFLQKRDRMTDIEPDWVHIDTDASGIRMNAYFVQHPEMILGDMVLESTRFGMDSTCKPYADADLSELLSEAIQNLHTQITDYEIGEPDEEDDRSISADPSVRNFSYTLTDGKVYYRENSRMYPIEVSITAENRIRGMISLRECVRTLIEYQTENYSDADIREQQNKLNQLYDDFTKRYGLLNSRGNSTAFGDDSSYCLLCSLEVLDEEGNLKRKADMFTKRTIRPHAPVTHVDTASEALAVSISEKACVDLPYMAQLSGLSEEKLAAELTGVIFRDIQCGETPEDISPGCLDLSRFPFVTADAYLSGHVRRKLRMAKALYEALPSEEKAQLASNIHALEAVQPSDLTAAEIGVRIGANWVPTSVYQQFMFELLGTSGYAKLRIKILRSSSTGQWAITEKNTDRGNVKSNTTYGTQRMNAYAILEQTLNQKDVRVFDYVEDENGNKKPVLNKKETAIAQDRQELIKQKFSEWIWNDIDRREQLCGIYNEIFNAIRPREYDGQHIRFSGMNPEITLRPHQINAIAHILYGGNTLLAHEVGAGKTFEIVAAAMEMKRLGLCAKSLIVVPNHITEQWASEWLQLYPSANILVATKKDFETKNRKKFCARISTGDYDAVIIGHSQFEKIPMSAERQAAILQQQIDEILFGIQEATSARAERYTVKQLERTKKALELKLAKLNDQSRKDDVVTFEELGVDRVFVDESHYFKNLFLATKMRNVGGIAQTEAQKSSDLFMKCRYLDEITDGRGVIFATGTPISNSMVELYTIQRYLQHRTLEEMGLIHFDDWASDFGETITAIELSPEGSGYRAKTRFAKFFNLPELMATFKQVADIQTADMLNLPVPKANFHTEVIQPSELQQECIQGLAERAERIRNGAVDPSVDNMLRITNDGRKLALDLRLLQPLAADDPTGKVSVCARNVHRIWAQTNNQRSAQLVFCDLSTPKDDSTFSVYNDLKQKLIVAGIPEEEIAFIHDANTEVRKKELFAKVRTGQVRILMGSTQKMGAGTNVQDRLIALHDLDCPWRPSDLAQRLGRIVRQGNQNEEVEIFRYVTEGTFDAYLYQLVENKQKFIAQVMISKTPVRVADDVDETALSYSEIKALATGNPLIIEKCNLDMEVGKLNMLKANYLSQKYALEDLALRKYPELITQLTERIAGYEQDIALAAAHPKLHEGFVGIELFGETYTNKESAGKAIITACTQMTGSDALALGQYRGFTLALSYNGADNEYFMTLKGTLSHSITLGADVFGNFTRMDNLLDGLSVKLNHEKAALSDTKTQLANARTELEAPFSKEQELSEKTARLKELNILLNMDEKDHSLIDDEPEEDEQEQKQKNYER